MLLYSKYIHRLLTCTLALITDLLNMECSEEDIYTITGYEFDWRYVGRRLLRGQKVRDIDNEGGSERDKRDKMLLEWKRTKSRDATYQALVKVLRAIENNNTADRVEELERKSKSQSNIYACAKNCTQELINRSNDLKIVQHKRKWVHLHL